jgi:hypothetical protein
VVLVALTQRNRKATRLLWQTHHQNMTHFWTRLKMKATCSRNFRTATQEAAYKVKNTPDGTFV